MKALLRSSILALVLFAGVAAMSSVQTPAALPGAPTPIPCSTACAQ